MCDNYISEVKDTQDTDISAVRDLFDTTTDLAETIVSAITEAISKSDNDDDVE